MAICRYLENGTFIEETQKLPPTLEQLQLWVGGYIEHVALLNYPEQGERSQMFLDEEGKLKGKGVNIQATKIFQSIWGAGDTINGDAVILTREHKVD